MRVVGVVIAVAIVLIVLWYVRSRRSHDAVDSFRRQIDALSPEARRTVVGQVHDAAGKVEPEAGEGADPAGTPVDDPEADPDARRSGGDGSDGT